MESGRTPLRESTLDWISPSALLGDGARIQLSQSVRSAPSSLSSPALLSFHALMSLLPLYFLFPFLWLNLLAFRMIHASILLTPSTFFVACCSVSSPLAFSLFPRQGAMPQLDLKDIKKKSMISVWKELQTSGEKNSAI